MNLHNQTRVDAGGGQPVVHRQHGHFDDISGSTLHRCVDCGALGGLLPLAIARVDLREVKPASPERLDISDVMR